MCINIHTGNTWTHIQADTHKYIKAYLTENKNGGLIRFPLRDSQYAGDICWSEIKTTRYSHKTDQIITHACS